MSIYGQNKPLQVAAKDTAAIKFDSLKAAVVTAPMRPHLKGDTLEYNTANAKMHPNALVEDLLQRLPGLQVDPDGTISYNGEKIQRLVVDGEDVFGNDPILTTRNFDANKIAKVQIIDQKSDASTFTGFDDGTRMKTLNLVIKESAKDGYFGKIEGGGDADGYYTAAGILAGFHERRQLTGLGLSGNTGVLNFGSNSSSLATIGVLHSNGDALGTSAGSGIPEFSAVALHYADRWNGVGDHLNVNYQYGHLWTHPITTSQTVQTLPDSIYIQNQQSQSINRQDQQAVRALYEWQLSRRSAFKFNFDGNFYQSHNQFEADADGLFNSVLVNNSKTAKHDESGQHTINGNASWRIQLGKEAGSVLSLSTGVSENHYLTDGFLYTLNSFYQPNGSLLYTDTIDQRKILSDQGVTANGSAAYIRPILPGTNIAFSYGLTLTLDKPIQNTFSRGNGKYDILVDSLTSSLRTQTVDENISIGLQGEVRHFMYSFGVGSIVHTYQQLDLRSDSLLRMQYLNWAPWLTINYVISSTFKMNLFFNTSTFQPSISQLAPIVNNNDPLHLTIGNPSLRAGNVDNFRIGFHWNNRWMVNLNLDISLSNNNITTKTLTDNLGRQISQPVNVHGGASDGFSFYVNRKLAGIDWSFHAASNYNRTINYVNADLSRNDVYTNVGGLGATKYIADKFSFHIKTNFSYFISNSSINSTSALHYWTQSYSGAVTFWLIPKYEMGSSVTYIWQQKNSTFVASPSILLWNAYVSRNFLRDKLVVKAQLNNILSQNTGISRTNNGNVNSETSTNILGRYSMLTIVYHFEKKWNK